MNRKTPQEKLEESRKEVKKLKKELEKLHLKSISFRGLVKEVATQLNKSVNEFYK